MKKMKSNVYSVYDKKAQSYSIPFLGYNHACAVRLVKASLDVNSMLSSYPDDYAIYQIAVYDDDTGCYESLEKKDFVAELSNIVPLPFDGDGDNVGERETVQDN